MIPYSLCKSTSYSRQISILCVLAVFTLLIIFPGTSNADLTEMTKLVPGDGAYNDLFGSSVAISGDCVIVGAPNDDEGVLTNSGAAYIFQRSGSTWNQIAKLIAPDRSHNDVFGYSVSISGDYAIVGKPFDDHTGSNYGSAYIFYRNQAGPNKWGQVAKLVATTDGGASDGGTNDFFGSSVSISGDYAIVGAPNDDDNGSDSGSAYIYQRFDSTWSQVEKLVAPEGAAGDLFGYSVAINGDEAVVGAPRDDYDIGADAGFIYFFKRSEDTWSTLGPGAGSGAAGDEFGGSVSIDGHFAIAGSHFYDGGEGLANSGSARIYEELNDSGLWYSYISNLLKPSDAAASDEFGFSVSISGDYAVIGSLKYINGTGTAYVFQKSTDDDDWPQLEKLIASDGSIWGFGSAVSISGKYAVVGAKWDINSAGSAYVYNMSSGPSPSPSRAMPWIPLLLLDE